MNNQHTLRIFDEDLNSLRQEIIALSTHVSEELHRAMTALVHNDAQLAEQVVASDRVVDTLQEKINTHTTRTLARQQAMRTTCGLFWRLLVSESIWNVSGITRKIPPNAASICHDPSLPNWPNSFNGWESASNPCYTRSRNPMFTTMPN